MLTLLNGHWSDHRLSWLIAPLIDGKQRMAGGVNAIGMRRSKPLE